MIVFEANYSKKLGLPGYSSHQYAVTIRTELADISQVTVESEKIHALLQSSVDREIQKTGYLPAPQSEPDQVNGSNGHQNGPMSGNGYRQRQNGHQNARHNGHHDQWKCSPKQQELIIRIVNENRLEKNHVEQLSQQLFGIGVRCLNKLQASGLIDELIHQQETNKVQSSLAGGRR